MKKNVLKIVSIALILALGGYLLFNTLFPRVKIEEENASIVFIDNHINEMLSAEESEIIKSIFSGKRLYLDNSSCGFDENISIRFGDLIFCPAMGDNCPIIKLGSRYFWISETDRKTIVQIFEKYGGLLPGA